MIKHLHSRVLVLALVAVIAAVNLFSNRVHATEFQKGLTSGVVSDAVFANPETSSRVSPQDQDVSVPLSEKLKAEYKENELLVRFEAGYESNAISNLLVTNGCEILKKYTLVPDLYLVKITDGAGVPDKAARLQQLSQVFYAEPNHVLHAVETIPDDQGFAGLYGMHNTGQDGGTVDADIDAPEAWDISTGSSSVVVGIIDSGIDYDHPDLVSNMWTNPGEIPANGIDDDGNGYVDDIHGWDWAYGDSDPSDYCGHGTHCAGTVGASGNNTIGVAGVCWTVKLMALKTLNDQGSGFSSSAISALQYAAANGATLTSNSWGGGGYSTSLRSAILASNMIFAAAAGNNSSDNDASGFYPASYDCDNIISVASLTRTNSLSWFSNYGLTSVDLGAYGSDILSTKPDNPTHISFGAPGQGLSSADYGIISGTSMATPQVAGVVALMYAANSSASWSDMKTAIMGSVVPVAALSGITVTGGSINAYNALAALSVETTVSSATTCPGNVTIPIEVTNLIDVAEFSLVLDYGTTHLTYGSYQNAHSELSTGTLSVVDNAGEITIAWNSATPATIASGTLLELVFSASATGSQAVEDMVWNSTTSYYQNSLGDPLQTMFTDGQTTINPLPDDAGAISGANALCQAPVSQTYSVAVIPNATSYNWTLIPPAAGIITGTGASVTIDFDAGYTGSVSVNIVGSNACGNGNGSSLNVEIKAEPTANAGVDRDICEGSSWLLSGQATNYQSILWSNPGGDGSFDDPTILNATYTPGTFDVVNGSVSLILTAYAVAPCTVNVTDEMVLSIQHSPTVNAGLDRSVCENQTATLTGQATYYQSILWETSGDGSFSNPIQLNTIYTPGANDLSNGSVVLTLNAGPVSPCSSSVSDQLVLSFEPIPTVNAGADQDICSSGAASLVGTATNYSPFTIQWTAASGGTFSDPNSLTTDFYPSQTEIDAGVANLTLSVAGYTPCNAPVVDQVKVNITHVPVPDAGPDDGMCETEVSYHLAGATALDYTSVTWQTSGDGSFLPSHGVLNPTYFPGTQDFLLGTVELTLAASPILPCTLDETDAMILDIRPAATVDAGADQFICDNETVDLEGVATDFDPTSVEWISLGGGTFSDNNSLITTYTPSATDIFNGVANCVLRVEGNPCAAVVSDAVSITILSGGPTVDAGNPLNMCETATNIALSGSSAGTYLSLEWATDGDGVFVPNNTDLHPDYWPGSQDMANGGVRLYLTAYPMAPCAGSSIDSVDVTINFEPIVNVGADVTICENNNLYTLTGITATNYSSLLWTTSGTGVFSDPTIPEPDYTPSSADKAATFVELQLEAFPVAPCPDGAVDSKILFFDPEPTVNAGLSQTICVGDFALLAGTATNYDPNSIVWSSANGGTFSDNYSLTTTYYPSVAEMNAGVAHLTLEVSGSNSCNFVVADDLVITINAAADVNAGADMEICTSAGNVTLSGATASDYSGVTWTTAGDGVFLPSDDVLHPDYHPGTADLAAGSVLLTLTAAPNAPCTLDVSDEMTLTFQPEPTAFAGADAEICYGDTYAITDGAATYYDDVVWQTSGTGTFSSANTPTPVYTPSAADYNLGSVTLTLTAIPLAPCADNAVDDMVLTITQLATADAGADGVICEGSTFTLNGSATNYSSYSWTSSGSGTFSPTNTLTPTYTPSLSDISFGSVLITLNVVGNGSCTELTTDEALLTINQEPLVDAGPDALMCQNGGVINGSGLYYDHIVWTTSGDGFFSNDTIETPYYTPGVADILNGSVILTITGYPVSPCTNVVSDFTIITIHTYPQANAGGDASICSNTTEYSLSSATASSYTSVSWSTGGSGSFSDNSIVNPFYYPSGADAAAGFVDLTLTAYNSPCTPARSTMRLTINADPTVDAGATQSICVSDLVALTDAWAEDYSSVLWTALDGSGTFSNNTIVNPIYTPSASDYLQPSVTLRLTAYAIPPCTETVFDDITIDISEAPTVSTGLTTVTICESGTYLVTTASASNYSSVAWSTTGDGTFSDGNTLTPTYIPGPLDRITGSAVLTITAQPQNPCTVEATSEFTLFLTPEPEVNAGIDDVICEGDIFPIPTSDAQYYNTLMWTTSGSGSFDDNSILHPNYIPSASDISLGAVTLTLTATSNPPCLAIVTDEMELTIIQNVMVDAGSDAVICGDESSYFIFDATASDNSSISWTTSGDGSFNNPALLNPVYTPGSADIAAGSVTLEITAVSISPCSGFATDQMTITLNPMPVVDAGPDDVVCDNGAYTCNFSSVSFEDHVEWTTTGTGTFNNVNQLHPTYIPSSSDVSLGSVYLRITAYGDVSCSANSVSDSLELSFTLSPEAFAGPDEGICESGIVISSATAANFSTLEWTSSGTSGTIINGNTLTPTYTPSPTDIANGMVTLTLTANPNTPCAVAVTDDVIFTIHLMATVDAGADASICETDTYFLMGNATDYTSLFWTTSGDGTFSNNGTLFPTYHPGMNDIVTGSAIITLSAESIAPCTQTITDNMVLTIESLPEVSAGNSTMICVGETYTTTTAWATNYATLHWTSSGSGTFDNPDVLNTVYTPSAGDLANGGFTLTLTATANMVCGGATDTDDVYVGIQEAPTADAGSDALICAGESYTVFDADATYYSSVTWTTSGNGTFVNQNSLAPTYIPGSADINSGTVTLTLISNSIAPCFGNAQDVMIITINPGPTADAGIDDTICEGDSFTFSTASTTNNSSFLWTTLGSGAFINANTLTPTYLPDAADIAAGFVILRLTAYPTTPCTDEVYDEMILTIVPMPEVFAGADHTICQGESYGIFDATAVNQHTVSWTTSGTGNFSNSAAVNPIYYPSAADITNGFVALTITATGNTPCTTDVSDFMILTIEPAAIADAGVDDITCYNTNYTVSTASASHYASLLWTHSGAGSLINTGTLNPTYIPVAADAGNTIVLTLTAFGTPNCGDATDQMQLEIVDAPEVFAGPDASSCSNTSYQIVNSTGSNYADIFWTTSGTGTFDNQTLLHPIYFPSSADLLAGHVVLTITVDALAPCTNSINDAFVLTFVPEPEVNAGVDEVICENEDITITSAWATHAATYQWSTSGTGVFVAGNTLTPTYQPSLDDINLGSVVLTVTGFGNPPCAEVTDDMTLLIVPGPQADAGADATICESGNFIVTGASASDYSSLNWTTSGTGTFANAATLTPTYTPSAQDIAAGSVILTLEAFANAPCVVSTTSSMQLTINSAPTVDAGSDGSVCEPMTFSVTGADATNYSTILWTTSGSGNFLNNNVLDAVYVPSIADYQAGSVILTLRADALAPCIGFVTDDLVLSLQAFPLVDAGPDEAICEDGSYTVTGASASDYVNLFWTTTGTGVLMGNTTLTPTYTPSAADALAGGVILTLHVDGDTPCQLAAEDQMNLLIISNPVVDAGIDTSLCQGTSYTVSTASARHAGAVSWNTSGSGSFVNANSLTPTYTPSSADFAAGSVVLTLEATAISPCVGVVSDNMTLTLFESVSAFAGTDAQICEGNTYYIFDALAENYSSILWSTTGTGTFNNAGLQNPTYTPSQADITSGAVSLTMTATGIGLCNNVVFDVMNLSITTAPEVNAGMDATVCGDTYTVTGASATSAQSLLWTSSGTGILTNETTLTPTYTASALDMVNGSVTLTLTATGFAPCAGTVTDQMVLNYAPAVTAFAGNDHTICEDISFTIPDATATNYASVLWTSSGDGLFVDETSPTPTYYPGVMDIANGNVYLRLTALPQAPCVDAVSDSSLLTISGFPEIDAGANDAVCETSSYTVSDASASNYTSILWMSDGDGVFANSNTLTPTYTPGALDIANGSVTLFLTANAVGPCSGQVTDDKVLMIQNQPVVFSGTNTSICNDDMLVISGAFAQFYTDLNWTSSGSGIFINNGTLTPTYIPSGPDTLNGSVIITLTATGVPPCFNSVSHSFILTFDEAPTVFAGADATICSSSFYSNLDATASHYSSLLWTTSGDGTFSDATLLHPNYFPGPGDRLNGLVNLTLTANGNGTCGSVSDVVTVIILADPTVNAGVDDVVCENATYTLSTATATDYSSLLWTTSGDGTFNNAGIVGATYTPGLTDIANGSVNLTLTATGIAPCTGVVSDAMTLTIQSLPTVDAGVDDIVCESGSYALSGSVSDAQSFEWSTSGDGTFDNVSSLTASYTPGPSDISSGTVMLTLTAISLTPCSTDVSDDMTLTIQYLPLADAGADDVTCENTPYTLSGTAQHQQSVLWTTSGDGSFDDATLLTASYTPGAVDATNGSVDLTLTSFATLPCAGDASDVMTLTIQSLPTADAGADAIICENDSYTLAGTATHEQSVLWTTSGDGVFDDVTLLTANYTPGTNDRLAGSVELTLNALAIAPCAVDASDMMTLTLQPGPTADAGADDVVCETGSYTLSGSAINYTGVLWTTSGDGTFDDPTILTATYTPGAADIVAGSVDLSLTAFDLVPCQDTDVMTLTITGLATADAGADDAICDNENYTLAGVATNQQSVLWTTSGDGTFDDATLSTATYSPGPADILTGSVDLTFTAFAQAPCTLDASDVMTLTIHPSPVVDAGSDADICEDHSYTLAGTASDYLSLFWTTSGDGSFDDATSLTATYIPGMADIASGTVDLTLTAFGISPCESQDMMTLTIQGLPTVDAGMGATICEGNMVTLNGSVVNGQNPVWTTSGDGTFDDATLLNATYLPGVNDLIAGSVDLTLTADPLAPCAFSASDIMTLTIQALPTADAGGDATICEDVSYTLPAMVTNQQSVLWTTSGDGNFDDPALITPTYTPGANDILIGSVDLTLTVQPIVPCTGDVSNMMTLTIQKLPVADAGADANICETDTYTLSGAAANQSAVLWNTSGDGTFDDASILTATYTPGTNDVLNGTVDLSLTAMAIGPCATDAIDMMTLTIQAQPIVDAGADDVVCENSSITLTGTAQNQQAVLWATSGDGVFDDATSLTATYTPGTNDILNLSVDLTLTASAISPCALDVSDMMTLTIQALPTADAGMDDAACEGSAYMLAGVATNQASVLWTTSGDGVFDDASLLNATYTPGSGDALNATVNLTLTAMAISPCATDASDMMTLSVLGLPTVDAGDNATICHDDSHVLSTSAASNYQSLLWTSSGAGTFDDPTILHPTYTPSVNIVDLTVVTLRLQATNNACSTVVYDSILLTIVPSPQADFTYVVDSCHTIHFEDASTAPSGYFLVAYDWDLGDGTTQDDPIFNHAYADGGIYNVTLTVTADSSGYTCSNTVTMPVIVPNTPTIYYTWDPEPTCLMDTTFFYGASGTPITDWYWNFDDGHDTTGQYAGHVFDNPGTYDVILYITDTNLCQNSLSQQVTINPIPQVSMQIFDSPTCAQSMTTFQGTADTGIEFWYWDFGDGGISEDQNPVHSYTNGGTYTVTLTATDSAGCSATATGEIIVVPTPTADFSYTMSGCNLFAFTDNSTLPPGYQEYSWHWDFGDGSTSDVPDPVHTYATGGFFDVKLVFTSDSLGYQCSDSITKTVQAPNTPNATFTWAPNPAQAGDNIGFFATSGSTITNWAWDFADGGTATGQNATHTYTNPGDYDVSLTVTDVNGCTFETVIQVNVGGLPPVDFSWDNACENTPIQFTTDATVTDVGAVAIYDWDFGDGTGSNNRDPLHTYLNANMYNVTLTIIDTLGYTSSVTHQVEVMPEPISMFSISSPNCENSETYFEDYSIALSGYLTTWEWDFGDGNTATINFPDDPDVSHIYPSTGTYTAMLTVTTSDGCQATSTQEVTITPSPIAQIDYDAGCMSGPISFHDVSSENGAGTIIARQWNFGDPASGSSNQSTQSDPTHLFSAAGTYEVTLSIQSQSGCTDADTMEITITDAPEVDFTFTPACMHEPVSFTITDLTNLDQYFWDFGDGHTSQQPDPENTYDSPGDYQVTLTVQTTDGCTATQTQTVTVNPLPQASFEYSQPTCVGDTIFFLNLSNSPNGAIVKWEWDFGDGNTETILAPNGGNTSHVYANDQSYDVTLTVTDSDSCQNTVTRTVISVASPVAEFNWEDACFGQPTQFYDLTNNTPDIGSWYWDFGDPLSGNTNTSTYQNPTHVFSSPGDYTVTLIVTNTQGCDDTITHDLSVSDAPDVSFTMSSDTLCANTRVSFAGTSTAQISTWYWDFGDGGYALTQNADYLYNAPGSYTVTLTVTDLAGCEASTSQQIVVKDPPLANFSYRNACLGDTTYFTDESYSQLGYIAGWEWDLGDGTTANIQNPTHLYATNDDFQVTLIATDNYGCADTIRQWVKVRTRPIAKIESFVQVCDPAGQVYFFDGSEPGADGNPIQTWEWNLNEGYYSTEIDPEYIYDITDTCYQVTLKVTDDNACYSTDTVEVCVFGQLEVEITADQVCLTQPTTFYANYLPENDSVASYSWNFHDGTPQITTYHDSIQHTFANPGLYNVELMAVDTNGCTAYASLEITIDSLPTPRFSYEAGACDTPMQFTDESLHGGNFIQTWLWDFGDPLSTEPNTSNEQNPTHLYSPNDSSYQVKLIVTNFNGCTDSITQTVYTRACLIANFYVPDTINLCALTEVCFADSSVFLTQNGNITQWDWDFGDGNTDSYTSFQSHACHSYQDNQGGTYQVTLTVTGEIGTQTYTNTITKEVLIRPTPMAAIIVQNNCLGDTTFFTDGSETYSEPITTWRWDFGDTSTDADTAIVANPYYIYPEYENYLTELIVANRWGCTDTTTTEVTIFKPPTAEFSWAETCQGYYTYFTDESTADSAQITNYFWHFGDPYTMDSVSEEQNPYHIYDSIDSYTVTMQITDANFCRSQISHEIEIYPVPTALFTLTEDWEGRQGQVKLDNLSEGAIDYFWDFDDTYTTTEENPIHQYEYDSDPIYNLMLVATNTYGCPDTLIYPYELLFTGLYVPNAFSPSVADETFNTFKPVGINLSEYKLEVFSSWGNLVFSSTRLENGQVAEGWDGTYEGQPLPTGTYIWRITARFSDDSYWRGSNNGDGNLETHGTVTLIR